MAKDHLTPNGQGCVTSLNISYFSRTTGCEQFVTSASKPMYGCVVESAAGVDISCRGGVAYGPIYTANGPGELDQLLT